MKDFKCRKSNKLFWAESRLEVKMLRYVLLLVACLLPSSAEGQNVIGEVDEGGHCLCKVVLPDGTFPMHRMEALEFTAQSLNVTVQQEITKMQSYQATFSLYLQRLRNLTRRVEVMEMGGVSYSELDFELLKLEIREMESLVVQLKASMNGSSVTVETLYAEIRNISVMVSQLETYDKNNVLAVRREIVALRKRLQDCEKNRETVHPTPPSYGSCSHGGLVNVSKPFVVQLNWKGFSSKYGGWGKDSFIGSTKKDMYWVAPLNPDARMMESFRRYQSYDDLLLYKNPTDRALSRLLYGNTYDYSSCGQGSGMIAFNSSLLYNCYNSRDLCKWNMDTNTVERKTLNNAVFNNRFSYAGVTYQDIDIAADEEGVWALFSSEASAGNMIIAKLNSSLMVENTWTTSQYKPGLTNAFMICGVLYVTRPVNTRREEIFYTYDTNTGQEGQVSIMMDKMMETVQSLSYNANDHKLYMYNDGYQVTYDCMFSR